MKVYLAPLVCNTVFKIGKANCVKKRLSQLDFPFDPKRIVVFNCHDEKVSFRLEKILHSVCMPKRCIQGEGFKDGSTEFFSTDMFDATLNVARAFSTGYHCVEVPYESYTTFDNCVFDVATVVSNFATMFRFARLKRKLTQEELADITGLSRRTISRAEQGENISTIAMFQILAAFGLLNDLKGWITRVE